MKSLYPILLCCLFILSFFSGNSQSSTLHLGSIVWNDSDGDGKKDINEYVIAGITVSLYADNNSDDLPDGAAIKTAITSAAGIYNLDGLNSGRYIISIPVIAGYRPGGIATTSTDPDNNIDNDNNGVKKVGNLLYSNAISLNSEDEPTTDGDGNNGNLTFDIALCGNSAIGDIVWFDANCNGIQDVGENGINGVIVTIAYSDGTIKTDATHNYNGRNGYYDFINIGPGTYKITFTAPAGYTASPSNSGSDDSTDSDPVNGGAVSVTIAADESDFTVDAGYCLGAANLNLGNIVWNDSDGDGKKDTNEYGIGGITVSLYNDNNSDNLPDGGVIRTTVTNVNGIYSFTGLTGGRHIISIPVLPGYRPGGIRATSNIPDNNVDNDNNGVRNEGGVLYSNAITLSAGDEPVIDGDGSNGNLTFDIALCGNSAIGDFVWLDANCNGVQDPQETGINGAAVTITHPDGSTATELSHNYNGRDGYYDFINLGPGTYTVSFTTPSGYTTSPPNVGSDDGKDSDPVSGSGVQVTIAADQSDFTIDAGYCKGTSNLNLGNLVWNDSDGDGKKDPNEYAIGGITVSLYTDNNSDNLPDGAAINTSETGVNGIYSFTGLAAGKYIISIPVLPGYRPGGIAATSNDPDNNVDNDNNGIRTAGDILYSNAITLSAGDEPSTDGDGSSGNLTFDIALCGNSAIGDFVWLDANCNGIQDAGELGINGASVTITYPDGTNATELTHTYNGHDGYYDFINIGPGTYSISFATPAFHTPAPANGGSDDSKDSDPVNSSSVLVTIAADESNFTIDAGFCAGTANLNLGNLVWNDSDGDGKKDANEYTIGGITVSLYADNNADNLPDGVAIRTTVTNLSGIYGFDNLTPGRYIISIPVLSGYQPGGIATTSNDPDNNVDNDNNGVRVAAGILYSRAITLSAGNEPTTEGDGSNGNLTFDIALCGNSAIGDFVWYDANCNGQQDAGEVGINGAIVTITYPDGTTATEITHNYNGHDGYYDFINVGPGTYTITFTTPSGYTSSPSDTGSDDSKDSDVANAAGVSVTIAANESDFTIDAGYCRPGNLHVGNLVWNDSDGDGKKDPNEYAIGGITVNLYTDNNSDNLPDGTAIQTTVTTTAGIYGFNNLPAGRYIISIPVLPGYVPGGVTATSSDPDNNVDNDNNGVRRDGDILFSNALTLSEGDEPATDGDGGNGNLTFDIALCGNSAIGNFVWFDANCNGLQDAGENGINGATVTITYPDGTTATEATHTYLGNDGYYDFINIGPGTYSITFTDPAGYTPSPANVGADDGKDSDPISGSAVSVIIAANQSDFTVDAGYCTGTATSLVLGNLVWNDINNNAVKDANEPGITGVVVNLYNDSNRDNVPDASAIATTTTASGFYGFTGLNTGEYIVGVVLPAGYAKGAAIATSNNPDNDIDNDNNGVTLLEGEVRTPFISLLAGSEPTDDGDGSNGNLTLDIALKGDATLGNYIWCDLDKDGVQDGNEVGIADATVKLIFPDGTIRTTATNAAGLYSFNALGPGSYTVQFVTPAGMSASPANVASDENDSDPINGEVVVTLVANETNTTVDAGFYRGTVCTPSALDTDGDCVPDSDDIDDDDDGILDVVESEGYDPLKDCDDDGLVNYKDETPGCGVPAGNDLYGVPYKPIAWTDCNSDLINDFFDWDRDGIINELDLDSDNDGILDVQETRDSKATDNNRDGMVDGIDNDGDGLLSTADANDNDPTIAASIGLIPGDPDRDGTANYLDLDSDGDGIVDNREALELDIFASAYTGLAMGTNDDDSDGVRTVNYTSSDNDADNFKGFGAKGILLRDNDGDGFPNPYDIDSDNDGITDNVEGQPTCSEVQPSAIDADKDGLDDAYDTDLNPCERKAPGITPYDKDFDGTPDIRDLDTDNDGAPDINEGSGIYADFVTDYSDSDGDGLIGEFDVFNMKTANAVFVNNVAHSQMGPNGNFDGPVPPGSNAQVPQSQVGSCPDVDRDWRNVAILPVSLIAFKGALAEQVVKLQWTVENEVNMSHYVVERSTDGFQFLEIGKMAAKSNSAVTVNYNFADDVAGLRANALYYRLKEVEKAGPSKLSTVLVFKLIEKQGITLSLYPNPAVKYFVLKVNAAKEGAATIRLSDAAGKTMVSKNIRITVGLNAITFNDIAGLSSGVYNVQVIIGREVFNQKLMITK